MARKDILTKNHLKMIIVVDRSGSMYGTPITQVNAAMGPLQKKLKKTAEENSVELEIKVIVFSDNAQCIVGTEDSFESIENFNWQDITADGGTNTPEALKMVNASLKCDGEVAHALPPVVILLTDGECNPGELPAYHAEIQKMKGKLAGNTGKEKVIRIGIGVGSYNEAQIADFATVGEINGKTTPLIFRVDHAEDLAEVINWVAVTSLYASLLPGQDDAFNMGEAEEEWLTEEDIEEA